MKLSGPAAAAIGLASLAALTSPASGQCEPEWSDEFAVGVDAPVHSIHAEFERAHVGGEFTLAGGAQALRVAAYEDGVWSAVGPGFSIWQGFCSTLSVFALLEVRIPEATGIIAAGNMSTWAGPGSLIARWDGVGWRVMGGGMSIGVTHSCGAVRDLAVFEAGAGATLYATGLFHTPAAGIARWNGAEWEDVDGGLGGFFVSGGGHVLGLHDDGSGNSLYVGGEFTQAGASAAMNIARWSPPRGWEAVGAGVDMAVRALVEFDDGGQRVLLAAGGAAASGRVMRWDGASWSPMGGAFNGRVRAMAVFDDGAGPAVHAGGEFTSVDGRAARRLAKWDGARWVEAAQGANDAVYALEVASHGGVETLLVGGAFTEVGGGVASERIARLVGCRGECYADCDGSGGLDFFDFLCFQNEFAAMTPYADCDGSGGHDFFDFLCFQNAFAAGCE